MDDYTFPAERSNNEPVISRFFALAPGSRIVNLTLQLEHRSPDAFVFCMSNRYTEALFHQWREREHLDACYEIFDIRGFCAAISRKIASSAYFSGCGDVTYRARNIDYRSPAAKLSPAITKFADNYSWQCEARAIWQPRQPSPPLQPWIIDVPAARSFARSFAFMGASGAVTRVDG